MTIKGSTIRTTEATRAHEVTRSYEDLVHTQNLHIWRNDVLRSEIEEESKEYGKG